MTHHDKHNSRRDELVLELAEEEGRLHARIAENRSAIVKHQQEAAKYSEWQRHGDAQQELAAAGRLAEQVRADDKRLRDIELERSRICSGNHPELAALAIVGAGKEIEAKQTEKAAAQKAFVAMLTPELRAAAQRYVTAAKNAEPLAPEPTLAVMLAMTATAQGGMQ
ncbi:MAG: hypothetical protein EKK46_15135 [Rhodocyclaceae bacterium]|nr:MAG: hypothetical protein EKK46_15135 [Rhodocyclaceae bacterium]